ncbi:MAG: galactokinase [Desulfobacteraceae bacterium]|nr:MAG: galactokinase [Desulfobacteraceae bacterium]
MSNIKSCLEQGPVETSAPCRIDMGGTLDLSTFHLPLRHMGPCTFNAALDLRTRVRISPYTKGKIRISSRGFNDLEVDVAHAPFDHPLGLIVAVAAYYGADGVHIEIDSASPPRSALGGSSVAAVALIWAFAKALDRSGHPMPRLHQVALLAHAIEQSVAGVPCGIQDQLAAVYGGVNGWYWPAEPGALAFERQEIVPAQECRAFSAHLLVAYCGVPHASRDINGTWVRDFLAGRYREEWRRIASLSRLFIQALASGQFGQAAAIMNQETDLRLLMTPDVLDEIGRQLVGEARRLQCGARFTGAGGGGCVWAIGELSQVRSLEPVWRQILSQRREAMILETSVAVNGVL